MTEQRYPAGWDQARVQRELAHYERMDNEEMMAEDEAALNAAGRTLMVVPTELVPAVRELIAGKTTDR